MNILILGGMHGNEPLGPQLVAALDQNPIPGVAALLANPRAIAANSRGTDADLNRSFPGDAASPLYETRRAAEIMQTAKGYDLILDFHNTLCPDNDCAFLGATPDPLLLKVADFLGLQRVITAEYDCINKYLPNCLSVEISVTGARMQITGWISLIAHLAQIDTLPNATGLRRYRYVQTLTNDDRDALNLPKASLKVFEPLPRSISSQLGRPYPTYPIFLGQNYTGNVYAGLIEPLFPE